MRVMLLSPYGHSIAEIIRRSQDQVVPGSHYIETDEWPDVDFIVMYGHRRIIQGPVLERYRGRIINIHGSYLPWNRGAYPNLFSWIEGTAKGASIHYVDAGIDTGPIIVRQEVDFTAAPQTTLATSYNAIKVVSEELFERSWPRIRKGDVQGMEQTPALGSSHTIAEAEPIIAALPMGWDTPVREINAVRS